MELKFEVSTRINKSVADVFEAVVNPDKLSAYFTTGGADARLETGKTVNWSFAEFPGSFPVDIKEIKMNQFIIFEWEAGDESGSAEEGYLTRVTMRFEPTDDGRTLVSIAEEGWRQDPQGLKFSYGNCSGWSQMLCAMKVWLEHGINLREGMYQ